MTAAPTGKAGFPEESLQSLLTDCSGLCYPSSPGTTMDILFSLSALQRSERFRNRLHAALEAMDGNERRLAQHVIVLLDSLSPDSRARLFANPLAEIDAAGGTYSAHDNHCIRGTRQVLAGVRHLIHHPAVRNTTFILSPCLFNEGPLYLPHAHALLFNEDPDATLAFTEREESTHFVWSDGLSLTLPNDGNGLPSGFDHPRLQPLPRIAGFPVLNAVAEAAPFLISFEPASQEEIAQSAERFDHALELLRQIWPLAYHALRRHVSALCILEQRNHSRSHSPPELPGTILMSLDDVECIGDLLCHESSHLRMNVFRLYDPIAHARSVEQEEAGFVSPWRPDLRPLRGLVDGVHAFLNVCRYHQRLRERLPDAWASGVIYERQKRNVIQANAALREHGIPTELGKMLLDKFDQEAALL
ncbi:MAG: hypothetical protein J0H48_11885 [Nitrosospira multiformis]|nr:hypothetical protein [Nitrosospira multiformis]